MKACWRWTAGSAVLIAAVVATPAAPAQKAGGGCTAAQWGTSSGANVCVKVNGAYVWGELPAKPGTTVAAASGKAGDGSSRMSPIALKRFADVADGWALKVNSAELNVPRSSPRVASFDRAGTTPPGKQFVMVNAEATYNGTKKASDLDLFLRIIGRKGVAVDVLGCPVLAKSLANLKDVLPGAKLSGDVCWVADADDGDFVLYAKVGFTSKDVYFALK